MRITQKKVLNLVSNNYIKWVLHCMKLCFVGECHLNIVMINVFTVMNMKVMVFQDVTPCSFLEKGTALQMELLPPCFGLYSTRALRFSTEILVPADKSTWHYIL